MELNRQIIIFFMVSQLGTLWESPIGLVTVYKNAAPIFVNTDGYNVTFLTPAVDGRSILYPTVTCADYNSLDIIGEEDVLYSFRVTVRSRRRRIFPR